ncbi:MAG: hypoxanthine phosphoribosyltransferase [Armatimonadota bacterium]
MAELSPLLTEAQIAARIAELAAEIAQDHGDEEVILVGILKGSIYFLADLSRHLGENVRVDTMRVSSYGDEMSSSGMVRLVSDLTLNIENRNVVLVEDIVDTGTTLEHLLELLGTRHPKQIRIAALLSKPETRTTDVPITYLGFEIPNAFVVGFGLDYAERYRNLPFIAIYREE